MKARRLLAILMRDPLNYRIKRQSGSHRRLVSRDHPPLTFAFHDRQTIDGPTVRSVLTKDVGLSNEQAAELL